RSEYPARAARDLRPLYRLSNRKFYVDEIYNAVIVAPVRWLARASAFIDKNVVDGLVLAVARTPRFVGRELLAPFQNGLIQFYAAAGAFVIVCLLIILLFMS